MSIPVIDTLHALGNFPVVDYTEVQCGNFRLDAVLSQSAASLALKADKTYVDTELAKKATPADITTAISGKADKTYVDTNFSKKSETYVKPSGGIPKTDLSSDVQTSLGKADTALQSHQSLAGYVQTNDSRLTDSRPASDVYSWAKSSTKPTYTKSEVGLGNVDNTSDADKPVSTATQNALDAKASNVSVEALDSRIDDVETDQTALDSRVSALEAGTTPEGSEVIGIRTGADGTLYDTAGDAVRTQVSNLDAKFDNVVNVKTSEATDCNSYVQNGIYNVDKTFTNIPSGMEQNGILVVMTTGDTTNRIVQLIYEYGAGGRRKAWMRFPNASSATGFTDWDYITINSAFESHVSAALSNKANSYIGSDLNNLMTTGIYYVGTSVTTAHKPSDVFVLLVFTNGTRGIQYAFDYYSNKTWTRQTKNSGATWTEWNQAFDDEVFDASLSDALSGYFNVYKSNIFDGSYISGVKLGGTSQYITIQSDSNYNSLALVKVQPNTKYTIVVEDKGAESNGYYYFKACTIPVEVSSASALYGKENTMLFAQTASYTKLVTITTPADAKMLLVQTSMTKKPFCQIAEGTISDFTVSTYTDSNKRYVVSTSDDTEKKNVSIRYNSATEYTINFGKYEAKLFYTDSDAADQHNWNVGKINCSGNVVVPSGTDILGPIKVSGDADFLSGVHGSSTTTELAVFADGEKVTLNSALNKKCNKVTIYMTDQCRRETDKSRVFDRYAIVEIENGKIHVTNTYKCVVSSVVVERATNGGLVAVRNDILNGAAMPNMPLSSAPSTSISNVSKNNTHAVLNTNYGDIEVNNIRGHENSTFAGFFQVFVNESPMRTKIYMDIMRNETVTNGQEICGEFELLFK